MESGWNRLLFSTENFSSSKERREIDGRISVTSKTLEFVSLCDHQSFCLKWLQVDESNLSPSSPPLQAQCCPQSQAEVSLLPFGGFIPFCLLVLLFTTLLRPSFMPHLQRTRIIRRVNGFFEMPHYC